MWGLVEVKQWIYGACMNEMEWFVILRHMFMMMFFGHGWLVFLIALLTSTI